MKDPGLRIGRKCSVIILSISKSFEMKCNRRQILDLSSNDVSKVFDFITNTLVVIQEYQII